MWPFRKRTPPGEPAASSPTSTEAVGDVRWTALSSAGTRIARAGGIYYSGGAVPPYARPAGDIGPWMLAETERQEVPVTIDRHPYPPERTAAPGADLPDAGHYPPDAAPISPADSGVHALPDAETIPTPCPHCFGTGHVMTTSDLLRQSLGLLGTDPAAHHHLMAVFYDRLLTAAPDLVPLFPPDLTDPLSTGEGKAQRDKLLGALLALGSMYDPDHPDSEDMQALLTHLERFGRTHKAFAQRPGGRVRGASVLEYAAVFNILMGTLRDATGSAWSAAYDGPWEEAYDFAARGMIASAWVADPPYPRTVRSADYGRSAADAEHARREAERRD